jgi:hypothetical protein
MLSKSIVSNIIFTTIYYFIAYSIFFMTMLFERFEPMGIFVPLYAIIFFFAGFTYAVGASSASGVIAGLFSTKITNLYILAILYALFPSLLTIIFLSSGDLAISLVSIIVISLITTASYLYVGYLTFLELKTKSAKPDVITISTSSEY